MNMRVKLLAIAALALLLCTVAVPMTVTAAAPAKTSWSGGVCMTNDLTLVMDKGSVGKATYDSTTNKYTVTVSRLAPGTYQFGVQATFPDGHKEYTGMAPNGVTVGDTGKGSDEGTAMSEVGAYTPSFDAKYHFVVFKSA